MALNKELQDEVDGIQGCIKGAANKNPMPERFTAVSHPDGTPAMLLTDTVTGRTTSVSLYGYGPVRQTLNDLFPDNC